jgi:parallel beta helix pectate lyase-like protein
VNATASRTSSGLRIAVVAAVVLVAGLVAWLAPGRGDGSPPPPRAAAPPTPTPGPRLPATPATFRAVFKAATGGETIVLAAGDYGRFRARPKADTVTVTAEPGAAVSMALVFKRAAHVAVERVTITSAELSGSTHDVRLARNTFTGPLLIRADQMAGANILLDGNTHAGIDRCGDCFEGRVDITGQSGSAAGITIQNSRFGPGGNADGIQNGGDGVRILGNEFVGIEASHGVHSDAIQLYGSRNTLIRGNWIHDTATGIMAPDGTDHEVIEDNVIDPGTYPYAVMIGNDDGSVIRHNTLPDGACSWDMRCGVLRLSVKPGTTGTVVQDNIVAQLGFDGGALPSVADHNLVLEAAGTADLAGAPTYTGGAEPATRDGYALAPGSLGAGAASDGRDVGAEH